MAVRPREWCRALRAFGPTRPRVWEPHGAATRLRRRGEKQPHCCGAKRPSTRCCLVSTGFEVCPLLKETCTGKTTAQTWALKARPGKAGERARSAGREGGASCPQAGPTDGRSRARLPAQRPPGGATAGRSPWALATPNLLATGGSGARRERLVGSPEPRTASVSAAPRPVTSGRSGWAPRRGPLPAPPGDRRPPRPGARTPA